MRKTPVYRALRFAFAKFLFHERSGAALVEFALVSVVVFLPLVLGVIEFGRNVWVKSTLTAAAREGVRYAIVHGNTNFGSVADSDSVATYVKNRTQLSGIVVRPRWTPSNSPGDTATVTITYPYVPIVKIFGSKVVTSKSKQIIAY